MPAVSAATSWKSSAGPRGEARVAGLQDTAADAAREQQRRVLAHPPEHQTHQEGDLDA
ncbi:hypothetical protein [Streptomyces sp. NPDC006997]|uniref:hypothetical protein n=1 Tax=Streptomyces sp. NPDC006997 TaxID=3155356 RepID=UPI0033D1CC28